MGVAADKGGGGNKADGREGGRNENNIHGKHAHNGCNSLK